MGWYLSAGGVASSQREFPRIIARGILPNPRLAGGGGVGGGAIGWVGLSLRFKGAAVTAAVDGVVVVELTDKLSPDGQRPPHHTHSTDKVLYVVKIDDWASGGSGMVAVGSGWHLAEFSELMIKPL